MKHLKLFEGIQHKLSLKESKYLYDHGYSIDYDIQLNGESIGKCEIETIFKDDSFDDKVDKNIFKRSFQFDYNNPVKKGDFNKYKYIVHLSGFKISKEQRGKGFGYKSIELILNSIDKDFPKNDGIYLSVLKNNSTAIGIYTKLGFQPISDYKDVIIMKR